MKARRPGRQSLFKRVFVALAALLLLGPYLIDVAYYGDLTPTHFAQLVDSHEEEIVSGAIVASADNPVDDSIVVERESVNAADPSSAADDSKRGSFSLFPALASHTSRPPPLS